MYDLFYHPCFPPFYDFSSKASILLTANVAFLGIPSNNSTNLYIRSATQIASYVSVVTSSSSMMLALLLRRQHRTRERGSPRAVVRLPLWHLRWVVKLSMCSMNFWQRIIIRDWAMKYSPSSIVYLMLCLCGGKFVISSVSDKQLTNECTA